MHTRSTARRIVALGALAATCLAAPAAHAQFLGTQATGSIQFNGAGPNYFDPANGLVPAGYSNSTQGTTVTVAEPAIEFGLNEAGFNFDTVNITNTTIILTDTVSNGAFPFLVTLTDTAFAGITFTKTSDTTNSFTFSRTGNTLSLNFAGTPTNGTYTAIFTAVTPEPGSVALLAGLAVTGVGFVRRRRARK